MNKMAMMNYQALLLSTANSLTSAAVVPSNPAFAPSIQSLITTVVSSSNLLFKTEYAKIYKLWQEQLMSMSVDDEENTTTINYLHAILLAMSALNDGTSATGEHMLIHVVMPLLNDEYHRSLMPTCVDIVAAACTKFTTQLDLFSNAVLQHFSQEFHAINDEEEELLQKAEKSWRNWSTCFLRVCDATTAAAAATPTPTPTPTPTSIPTPTTSFNVHQFLQQQLLPQLCRCSLNVDSEYIRVAALRIFATPTVRVLFQHEPKVMEQLWKDAVQLWSSTPSPTATISSTNQEEPTKRIAYDVLAHTLELCPTTVYENEQTWTIVLKGLVPSKDENVQKISLHLLHLLCQRIYEDDRWIYKGENKEEQKQSIRRRQQWGRRMEQFRALYSVLDEFSHHLIDSMWPEMKSLYHLHDEATTSTTASFPPQFMVPDFNWTSIILTKAFKHDNPSVRSHLIARFLEFPFTSNQHYQIDPYFISTVLLPALDWPMFYRRHVDGIETTLMAFMHRVLSSTANQHEVGVYLRTYIKGLVNVVNPYAIACLLQLFPYLKQHGSSKLLNSCKNTFHDEQLVQILSITSKNIDMHMSQHLVAKGVVTALTMCGNLFDTNSNEGSAETKNAGSSTVSVQTLRTLGMILSKFRPSMLCPGNAHARGKY